MVRAIGAAIGVVAPIMAAPAVAGNVLAVHSYHQGYEWDDGWRAALHDSLSEHDFTHVYMDTKRLSESEFEQRAEQAWQTFQDRDFDAVVLGDDNALSYLGPRIVENSDVPVVFLGINNNPRQYFDGMNLPDQVTGVLERPLLGLNVRVIRDILPEADKLRVLFDEGVTGEAAKERIEDVSQGLRDITVQTMLLGDFAKWKEAVRAADADGVDVILPGLYFRQRDESGEAVPAEKVITSTHEHTPVPMMGFWGFAVGKNKAMAGVVLDGRLMGVAAADKLRQVLADGTIPETSVVRGGKLVASKSGLQRWDISLPSYDRFEIEGVE